MVVANKAHVLVVEDDTTLAMGLELNLRAEGHRVTIASDGEAGLRRALADHPDQPDLILLDLMLPKLDGFDVLAELRRRGLQVPVLILSARGEIDDKVRGLGLGADDYLTKPFSVRELAARVAVALRRERRHSQRVVRFADVEVDIDAREVRRAGTTVEVTPREFELLAWLVARPGRLQSRERLLDAIWGWDYDGTARTVDNFVRRLRVKLEVDPTEPRHLVTVRGAGYRFDA